MAIERTLEHIATKAHLHDWIDSLPEGTQVVVLTHPPDGQVGGARYCHMNNPSVERSYFMAMSFASWLLNLTGLV